MLVADVIVRRLNCVIRTEAEQYSGFRKTAVADNAGIQIDLEVTNIKEDSWAALRKNFDRHIYSSYYRPNLMVSQQWRSGTAAEVARGTNDRKACPWHHRRA